MKPTREELTKKHGTPAEFSKAVWNAQAHGEITGFEASCAIAAYEREWCDAPTATSPDPKSSAA